MTDNRYMKEMRERVARRETKQRAVFAIVGGGLISLYFGFRFAYIPGGPSRLWLALFFSGVTIMVLGIVNPYMIKPLEGSLRRVGNIIGEAVLNSLLTMIYFLLITPVGRIWRGFRGNAPFTEWEDDPPSEMEGWTKKRFTPHETGSGSGGRSAFVQMFRVFHYFFQNRQYVFLPVLFVLVALGITLFFIKSSSLAPFIYTLF